MTYQSLKMVKAAALLVFWLKYMEELGLTEKCQDIVTTWKMLKGQNQNSNKQTLVTSIYMCYILQTFLTVIINFLSGYNDPYLICYTENSVFIFDAHSGEWLQTLCLKKVSFLCIHDVTIWATSWGNLFMPYANNKGVDVETFGWKWHEKTG